MEEALVQIQIEAGVVMGCDHPSVILDDRGDTVQLTCAICGAKGSVCGSLGEAMMEYSGELGETSDLTRLGAAHIPGAALRSQIQETWPW